MRALRYWSVRRARLLERAYAGLEAGLRALAPYFRRIGEPAAERALLLAERPLKRALFDCRMCGRCILSDTGMSCPMNCPKQLRNGPCGGVRPDGSCEVVPEMPCVWVQAVVGSARMAAPGRIEALQPPLDHRLWGRSSWLAVAREAEGAGR
jgi:hypothetical protein